MNKIEDLEKWWRRWQSKNGKHFAGSEAKPGSAGADGEKAFLSASWKRWSKDFADRMTTEMSKRKIQNLRRRI
jgi:hypothetical protein